MNTAHLPHGSSALPFVSVFLFAFVSASQADNWPRFRGPTGQGSSTEKNIPLHWSAMSNVVWKTAVPVQGWSSPIVWGDRVFLTGTSADGANCHVLSFDRDSGR